MYDMYAGMVEQLERCHCSTDSDLTSTWSPLSHSDNSLNTPIIALPRSFALRKSTVVVMQTVGEYTTRRNLISVCRQAPECFETLRRLTALSYPECRVQRQYRRNLLLTCAQRVGQSDTCNGQGVLVWSGKSSRCLSSTLRLTAVRPPVGLRPRPMAS